MAAQPIQSAQPPKLTPFYSTVGTRYGLKIALRKVTVGLIDGDYSIGKDRPNKKTPPPK